jgi:hypothetical protein
VPNHPILQFHLKHKYSAKDKNKLLLLARSADTSAGSPRIPAKTKPKLVVGSENQLILLKHKLLVV